MIQLSYIDYLAVEGRSILHRLSPKWKIIGLIFVLLGVVLIRNMIALIMLYGSLFFLFLLTQLPLNLFLITFYPLIFGSLFLLITGFKLHLVLIIFLKLLSGSTGVVLLIATTPYPLIFSIIDRFLPSLFVTSLFLTYRCIFILMKVLEETQHAIYLRGGLQWKHPIRSIINISNAFGHLIIAGIEASERMYESMLLRGFKNRIHYRDEKYWIKRNP